MNKNQFESINVLLDEALNLIFRHEYEKLDSILDRAAFMIRTEISSFDKEQIDQLQVKIENLMNILSVAKDNVKQSLLEIQQRIRTLLHFNPSDE